MHRSRPIYRLLEGDLAPGAEARLRAHLRGCRRCRRVYAEERALRRALAGDPTRPTAAEDAVLVTAVLAAAQLPTAGEAEAEEARRPAAERRLAAVVDRILWLPGPALAGATVALAVALGIAAGALRRRPHPPVGWIHRGSEVALDGHLRAIGHTPLTLHPGDRIAVGTGGVAVLELARPGEVRVYPGTTLTVGARGDEVGLEAGRVWCRIPEGHGGFAVRTPDAVVRDLGTSFVVSHEADHGTSVGVVSGRVRVRGRHRHRAVVLTAHQETTVRHGDDPSPPSHYDDRADRIDWARVWHHFLQGLQRALEKVKRLFR